MEGGWWLVGGCFIGDVIDLVSERLEFLFQCLFCGFFAVYEANLFGFIGDGLDVSEQVGLICVCGVTGEGVGLSADWVFTLIDSDRAFALVTFLDCATGGPDGLVSDEEDIGIGLVEESFEVVHDSAP